MPQPQTFSNHARFEPLFHFFAAPVLLINVIVTIVLLIQHWNDRLWLHLWLVVVAVALLLTAGIARGYALKVQDRVIRVEEYLRYHRLLSPEAAIAAQALSIQQVIALRFTSDPELPTLLQRTLTENLAPKQIKQAIQVWRADTQRV